MDRIKVALIGAGHRGMMSYAPYALAHPGEVEFIAVAEPDSKKRERFAALHKIPQNLQFESWEDMLKRPRLCRAVLICTQDNEHYKPTMAAIELGYDILVEKPMSNNMDECIKMQKAADEKGRILMVCHVLRYTNFYAKVKQLLNEGRIGDIVSIQQTENVGYWHHAHSFVRGNWSKTETSSPMILQKSCHDLDILNYLIGKKCLKISSFGGLKHFRKENAPVGAAKRCSDGCAVEADCPYSALKIYKAIDDWPTAIITRDTTPEGVLEALKKGPYGRCVYHCDNNVVDHQVVNMEYEDGITVSFTMSAFTDFESGRTFKIMGTKGQIRACSGKSIIEVIDFNNGCVDVITTNSEGGHGGGDEGIMRYFIHLLHTGIKDPLTSAKISLVSHLMAFAAEKARMEGSVVSIEEFSREGKHNVQT